MAGDDPQVVAAQQFGRPPGDVAVAGPVEPPAADAEGIIPLVGNGVELVMLRDRAMEVGLEGRHEGDLRQLFGQQAHGGDVGRIVRRGYAAHFLHGRRAHRA